MVLSSGADAEPSSEEALDGEEAASPANARPAVASEGIGWGGEASDEDAAVPDAQGGLSLPRIV